MVDEPVMNAPLAVETYDRSTTTAASAVVEVLAHLGVEGAVGVADSQLADVMAALSARMPVTFTVREDIAVGMAFGADLAGVHHAVFMKNAGLGTSLDALVSLALGAVTPLTIVIGWAGAGTDTLPHHVVAGQRTVALLEAIGVAFDVVERDDNDVDRLVAQARDCRARGLTFVLLVRP